MGFGLFGKLPQKRDFVSVNLPNSVLNPFETWLQSGVAASRTEIGRDWENYYRVAPIWHFWLGPDIFGTACAGAMMPSVDQVGRYFPLSIIYCAEPNETLPPPLLAPLDYWYAQLDQRLLAVLGHDGEFEIAAVLAGLERPVFDGAVAEVSVRLPGQAIVELAPAPAAEPPPAPAAPEPIAPLPEPVPEPAVATAAEPAADVAPEAAPEEEMSVDKPLEDAVAAALSAPASAASPWDDPPPAEPLAVVGGATLGGPPPAAPSAAAAAPAPASKAATWDDLPDLDAKDFGLPATAEGSGIRDRPPTGKTVPPAPPALPAGAAAEPPAPASSGAAALLPPPQIASALFKGGVHSWIEPGRTFNEALGGLLDIDYRQASAGRGFWWCGASSTGYASFFGKQGLPDPYFFSRMLMWSGNQ